MSEKISHPAQPFIFLRKMEKNVEIKFHKHSEKDALQKTSACHHNVPNNKTLNKVNNEFYQLESIFEVK